MEEKPKIKNKRLMDPYEAMELSRKFPKNKSVPKRIYDAMQQANEDDKKKFEMIIEGLYVTAIDNEDFEVLNKYFG